MANIRTLMEERPMAPLVSFIRWDYLLATIVFGAIALICWPTT